MEHGVPVPLYQGVFRKEVHGILGLILGSTEKTGIVAHACGPSTQEVKTGDQKLKRILGYAEFESSLGYVRSCLNK